MRDVTGRKAIDLVSTGIDPFSKASYESLGSSPEVQERRSYRWLVLSGARGRSIWGAQLRLRGLMAYRREAVGDLGKGLRRPAKLFNPTGNQRFTTTYGKPSCAAM